MAVDSQSRPISLAFPEAPPAIIAAAAAKIASSPWAVSIGITGPVGSGKSTLARAIADSTGAVVVASDNYLPDYDRVPFSERDDPRHADLPLLATHLARLRTGKSADIPLWSFHSHRREGARPIGPPARGQIVICEGIHALHPTVRPHLDVAVFVSASAQTRWRRWERLETSGERGWGVAHARKHFDEVAEPTFDRESSSLLATADFVVTNE